VGALFQRGGRGWKILDYALRPSDVAWSDGPSRYGALQAVFDEESVRQILPTDLCDSNQCDGMEER